MSYSPSRIAFLSVSLVLLGLAGCTPTPINVEGHLLWDDGKPVNGANIRFVSESGAPEAVGFTDKEGAFTLTSAGAAPGAVAGDYKVVVTKSGMANFKGLGGASPEDMAKAMQGSEKNKSQPKIVDPVPAIYGSETTTTLKIKIDANNHKPELKISRK